MEQYNRNLNSKTENAETMLQTILTECDKRQENKCTQCTDCKFGEFCPHDCEKCLEYIHFPKRVPQGGNMTVLTWLISILVNTRANMHQR